MPAYLTRMYYRRRESPVFNALRFLRDFVDKVNALLRIPRETRFIRGPAMPCTKRRSWHRISRLQWRSILSYVIVISRCI